MKRPFDIAADLHDSLARLRTELRGAGLNLEQVRADALDRQEEHRGRELSRHAVEPHADDILDSLQRAALGGGPDGAGAAP